MQAVVRTTYGPPEVLRLQTVDKPDLADDGVLVRVRASSVNRGDYYTMTGKPYLARGMMGGIRRPKSELLGTDFAGTVEAVGKDISGFGPGDEVFGGRSGAFAEFVCARSIARKPSSLSFEEAAAVPVAGLTALQGLRDKGHVGPGQQVLINGASGGVGVFAVQVAKALGADVTAVCRTRNVDMVRSLGADHVVDYTQEDFTRSSSRYDVIFDVAGSRSWWELRRVLKPKSIVVIVGAPTGSGLLGPLTHIAKLRLSSLLSRQRAVFFIAKFNREDMEALRELLEDGRVRPVVERRYDLRDAADAMRYMGEGHAQAKIVIAI